MRDIIVFAAILTLGVLLPLQALAQSRSGVDDDNDAKTRVEIEVRLPAMPKPENLLPFEAGAASTNRFFVDAASITINDDETVRYTLVVRGAGGAENVSYEGMRCDTKEQTFYAFGRRDGTWASVRSPAWRAIRYQEVNRQHGVLYAAYFCPDGSPIRTVADAVQRFKYGVPYGAPPRSANKR
jgi:hypothetical protein